MGYNALMTDSHRPCVVLGEVLCDLFPATRSGRIEVGEPLFPQSGGAPANVAIQLARLGVPVSLITAVGDDPLGELVASSLAGEGVDLAQLKRDPLHRTGLTLVMLDEDGERTFYPWRADAADQHLAPEDLDEKRIAEAAILHHGTVSLRSDPSRRATARAVEVARGRDAIVTLDVNLRPRMFASRESLLDAARVAVRTAHAVKATRGEAAAITGTDDEKAQILALHAEGPALVLLTRDEQGAVISLKSSALDRHEVVEVSSPRVEAVDATGAGDAFMGAAIAVLHHYRLRASSLYELDLTRLGALGAAACRAGALAVTALGATAGMTRDLGLADKDDVATR